jgi:two-component system, chemotaxis family, protein-glutamate methylesterase/glutaminase
MRVLVVDDTVLFRRVVSDALTGIPGVDVVGTASNGKLALKQVATLQPDLITLDLEMPEMNGLGVLQSLNHNSSDAGVVLLSAHTARGGELTVRCLELGAFDFVSKPIGGGVAENVAILREELIPILRAFERKRSIRNVLRVRDRKVRSTAPPVPAPQPVSATNTLSLPRRRDSGPAFVLIAASTGGPAALARVLSALPANLESPVLIVQHMPPLFTEALASNLDDKAALKVKQGSDGERALAGTAYLAPGGRHMKLERGDAGEALIRITDDAPENNCKPAADCLFRSAALNFPGRSIAVVLTGMGSDGTRGLQMLKRAGCFGIAQDEASSTVFGMPKEAISAGVVDCVAPLDMVALAILREIRETGP